MRPCYGPLFLSRARSARWKKGTITWAQVRGIFCFQGMQMGYWVNTVARSIFDAPFVSLSFVREANERTTGWIRDGLLDALSVMSLYWLLLNHLPGSSWLYLLMFTTARKAKQRERHAEPSNKSFASKRAGGQSRDLNFLPLMSLKNVMTQNPYPNPFPESRRCPEFNHNPINCLTLSDPHFPGCAAPLYVSLRSLRSNKA